MLPRLFQLGHIGGSSLSRSWYVRHLPGHLAPLLGQVPVAGVPLVQLVDGGPEVGELTLQLQETFGLFSADFLNLWHSGEKMTLEGRRTTKGRKTKFDLATKLCKAGVRIYRSRCSLPQGSTHLVRPETTRLDVDLPTMSLDIGSTLWKSGSGPRWPWSETCTCPPRPAASPTGEKPPEIGWDVNILNFTEYHKKYWRREATSTSCFTAMPMMRAHLDDDDNK